jgi:hypothetical protein
MIADRPSSGHPRIANVLGLAILALLSLGLAACSSSATPAPAAAITTADEAAAAVAATNTRFEGIEQKNPDLIGQGSFWEAMPVASGAYGGGSTDSWTVTYTIGWGDCPAGCINQHVWTYRVDADGTVTLLSETGDPLQSGAS